MATATIDRQNIRCPVCRDVFDDPRVLSCGHSFCYKCIDQLISKQFGLKPRSILCPLCNKPIGTPTIKADQFPKNYSMISITSELDSKENSSVLTLYNDKLKLFCAHHDVAISTSSGFLKHRRCKEGKIVTIEEATKEKMSSVNELLDKIKKVEQNAKSMMTILDEMDEELVSSAAVCDQEIKVQCNKIHKEINAKKDKLCGDLQVQEDAIRNEIAVQKTNIDKLLYEIGNTRSSFEKTTPDIDELVSLLKKQSWLEKQMENWNKTIMCFKREAQFKRVYFQPAEVMAKLIGSTLGTVNTSFLFKGKLGRSPPKFFSDH